MAEKNIIRQDIVQILFETAGVEDILNSETALSGLKGALKQLAKDSEHCEESNKKNTQSMMGMFAQSELLGKLADAGKKVIDVLMDCVDASAEFQTSLAKLETIANTNAVPMETLSNDLLALSNDTGVAVTSLTESAYQAVSASVDTASAVDFVAQANELAAGGFTSTETAVDVLSTAINAYGLEVSEAGQLSDYLITTQNLGKTSVDQLAQSVGKVIPLASAYNVEMDNLSSAYAVLTANGIATAETGTYLKSMLTELADTGSTVAGVLQEETGISFSELSASGQSLGDVLSIIGASVDNDATAFSNLWSSSEAGVGALSLLNAGTEKYNSVLNEMQNSTGAASQAHETMTGTAKHAQEELTNAANNLKIAVGNSLLDTFTDLNHKGADALNWLTDFVQEHETLVSSLTAGIAVAAAATVGIVGLSAAVATLAAAAEALNLTTGGALKIAGLIVGGIAALATGIAALNGVLSDGKEDVEDYDGTLEECRNEIELTDAALAKAKSRYGENSDAVKDLESDLDTLNKQYEKGGGYLAELREKSELAAESIDALQESIQSQNEATDSMEVSGLQAVSVLEALSDKSKKTNTDLDLMQSYADYLNDTFNCNIQVNYDTGALTGFNPSAVVNEILESAEKARAQTARDTLSDPTLLEDYTTQYEKMTSAQNELAKIQANAGAEYLKAREELIAAFGDATDTDIIHQMSINGVSDSVIDAVPEGILSQLEDAEATVKETKANFEETNQVIQEQCDALDETGGTYETLTDTLRSYNKAAEDSVDELSGQEEGFAKAQDAITAYNDQLYELCEAYDKAYESALESIDGQYAIWDKVEDVQATSADSIINALNSQNQYWTEYSDNLITLQERASGIEGLGDMLASMADGSEESAAALAGLATASDTELATAVDAWQNLKQNQDDTANNMASVQTQFESTLSNIRGEMDSFVTGMDKESEAYAAATSTMDGFIRGISDKMAEAQSALSSLTLTASQVANVNITAPLQANALGTTDASDVFIAGEQGAELIVGMGGSTVFPASETEKIIDTVADYMDFSVGYTPGSTSVRSLNNDITYAPVFNLTQYGGTTIPNQKQVKRWMRQTLDDAFLGMLRTNPPVYEI